MTDIQFRSSMTVELRDHMGDDERVVQAARVSTGHDLEKVADKTLEGLIRYLMKNRHGTPFEHNAYTFRIECPKFVTIEFMRHRIASYNEESARYTQLDAVFWLPSTSRPIMQGNGKPGHYELLHGSNEQHQELCRRGRERYTRAYRDYERDLADGYAREVARAWLPFGIYTSFYVTLNARSMMNFLSLRVDSPDAAFVTKPQHEIQEVAHFVEWEFSKHMPVTHNAFTENGRIAP